MEIHLVKMDETLEINLSTDISTSPLSSELVTYKENPIRDISLLTKNFDLSSMPPNYMRRRSKIEEIIYRAVFSQNNHKSPFASFNIAKNCMKDLDKIDIVTGVNNLKKVIKAIHSNSEQISIMVHKVADTWLLDEFDMDALFLRHQHYADWDWLRNFIKQESFQLAKADLSRASLSMRDLYAKFLYHSVSQPSIEMPNNEIEGVSERDSSQLSVVKKPMKFNQLGSKFSGTNRFDAKNEDFINLVDWKLEDLSFVVGSDLSIFGTKTHPCISLRLSPCHEPINILTGIDMWLENMLNEVPEIAMCYHDQGIVMREYEILKTNDIPKLAVFNEDEVKSIAKNLSHFLSTNATKEGHTYWLFKEADSTTVKLYDLTNIWEKEQYKINRENNQNYCDSNPFIIPVANLCYKMAENRVNQWYRAREKRGKTKLTSSQFNKELQDNKLADNQFYFNEIFRLLKNCINLLMKTDKHQELVRKAMLMMCRLYLEVDQATLNNLQCQQDSGFSGTAKLDLNDLKKDDATFASESAPIENTSESNFHLIGSQLFNLCANKNTQEILERAMTLIDINSVDHQSKILANNEIFSRTTLLCDKKSETTENGLQTTVESRQIAVKENLTDSVIMYYMRQSIEKDATKANFEELKVILKSGFIVALLTEEIVNDDMKLLKEHDCYCAMIVSFINLHCDFQEVMDTNVMFTLSNVDKKVLSYHYENRNEQFLNAIFMFKAIFMPEKKRLEMNITDKVHYGWYQAVLYLTSLSYKLMQLSLIKTKHVLIQRGMPILLNFLVAAIVTVYQQKTLENNDPELKNHYIREWCLKTVLPSINWISEWTNLADFDDNLKESLVALVWLNQAKLYRLAYVIMCDKIYNYHAIDSYSNGIETLSRFGKKKPTPMSLNIRCDRLDVCILILENAYSCKKQEDDESIAELNKAVEIADKIYRADLPLQVHQAINMKLTSLRLRINFVRYYLNLKANQSLNYDQVLNDLKNDLGLIMTQTDNLVKCKEITLIEFYMFKIQIDRCEILSVDSIRKFIRENSSILKKNLITESYHVYFANEGRTTITGIYQYFMAILAFLVRKCKVESHRKKKQQIDLAKINHIESFLVNLENEDKSNLPTHQLLKNLILEIENIV